MAIYFLRPSKATVYHADTGLTVASCATSCVPCEAMEVVDSGGISGSNYVAYIKTVTELCATPASFDVSVVWDGFGTFGNEFYISRNGVVIWTSGCTAGSGSTTVTVAAGATTLVVGVVGACDGPGSDQWSLLVICL